MITINKIYMIPSRKSGYKDMYNRSYNLNVTQGTINDLENVLSRTAVASNGTLSDIAVVQNMPNVISLDANPLGMANIINGWGTQRLAFIMEVESNDMGINMVSYIQGFSEYHDPSLSGRIDPDVRFHINSINTVIRMLDPISGMVIVKPHSNFNIIKDTFNNVQYQEVTDTDLKLIRPTDIISNINNINVFGHGMENVHVLTDNVAGVTSVSARGNNNPIKHFTKTVNSYISSKNTQDLGYADDSEILTTASETASETNLVSIPFIMELYKLTGLPTPSDFSMNLLSKLDPGVADKVLLIENDTSLVQHANTILDSENTEDMYKPNLESIIATTVAHSINDMLVSNLLAEISFATTNITGATVTTITNARSFIEGINVTSYVNKLVTGIDHILMPEITQNGLLNVEVIVSSSLLLETTVSVSINMQPPVVFRFPTFCDSTYVPVVSTQQQSTLLSDDFGTVLDTVNTVSVPAERIHY